MKSISVLFLGIQLTAVADDQWSALRSWVNAGAMSILAPGNRFYSPPPGAVRTVLMRRPPSTVTVADGRATYHSKLAGLDRFEFYGAAIQDPLRMVDGTEVSLIPVFSGLENDLPIPKGFDKWDWVVGTVQQARAGGGMLIATGTADIPGKTVMVLHYPRLLADGDHFSGLAIPIGNTSHEDIHHATITLATYDYGALPSKERMEDFVAEYQAALDRLITNRTKIPVPK